MPRILVYWCVLIVAPCSAQQTITLLRGPVNEPYTASPDVQADSIIVASSPAWGVSVLAASQAPWLTFKSDCSAPGAGSGTAGGITPITLNFCVDPSQVSASGYYIGLIEVTSPGDATLVVAIKLTKFPTGDLSASPDSVVLTATQLSQTIAVTADPAGQNNLNNGFSTTLSFTAGLGKPNPPEGSWLSVSQTNPSTPGSVVLTANVQALAGAGPGTYVNTLVLKDTKYGDIKTVKVSLTIQSQDLLSISALPHIAVGDVWVTGFNLINNGSQPATATLSFYNDAGQPLSIPIAGEGTQNTLVVNLNANGSAYYEAGTPQFGLQGGWARVNASPSVVVQALFRSDNGGGDYTEAAVPASSGGHGFLIPFDATTFSPTGAQLFTGIGIANMDSSTQANINCVTRDSLGTVMPGAFTIPPISSLGHFAEFNFPLLAGKRGTIQCTSNTNIAALALRFIGSGNAFSSLPVITTQ